jgi:hypothetical protein
MLEGKTYKIAFSKEPPSFSLRVQTEDGEEPYQKLAGRIGRRQNLPEGCLFKTENSDIFFHPDGSTTQTQVTFTNVLKDTFNLEITSDGRIIEPR